jgi:hypothetical protein
MERPWRAARMRSRSFTAVSTLRIVSVAMGVSSCRVLEALKVGVLSAAMPNVV